MQQALMDQVMLTDFKVFIIRVYFVKNILYNTVLLKYIIIKAVLFGTAFINVIIFNN